MSHLHLPLELLPAHVNRLFVAFSGGVDSSVLLHRLLEYKNQYTIILWHINHGLQGNAMSMQDFATTQAQSYGLESRIDCLKLNPGDGNLEANARQQRYGLFAAVLSNHDALLTAHHMNDQAETLLLNMMRGSGASGLRAIAMQKRLGQGFLFRPLLNSTREDILNYARHFQLEWVEDPSNDSLHFDRNYIRHQVMPALNKRWPSSVSQMHRVCEWQNESHTLMHELAQLDLQECIAKRAFSELACLFIQPLLVLSDARKKNLIRHWIKEQGKSVIGYKKIDQLLSLLHSKMDASPVVAGDDYSIRFYQGYLYIVNDLAKYSLSSSYSFSADSDLEIPCIGFRQSRKSILEKINRTDEGQAIRIQFRSRTGSRSPYSHRLKRLFQQHQVPPWIRPITPQIIVDEELVALWLF